MLTASPDAGAYQARFRATYAGILTFVHTAELTATNTTGGVSFTGEADLGRFAGGRYRYEGRATPEAFSLQYTARKDHGRFELRRPAE